MDRRQFTQMMAGAAGTALLGAKSEPSSSASAATKGTRERRPNILLFISDDHGIGESSCYGNDAIRTPNIDRLASEGMRFTRAFVPEAICTPSRSMLYTGLFPHRHGAHRNHSAVRAGTRSLPHYFGPLGYSVALAGKTHIKPKDCFPFEYLAAAGVKRYLNEVGDKPFLLVYASKEPHGPYQKRPAGQGYDPAKVIIPPYLADTPKTREIMADYYNSIDNVDRELGDILALLEKRGLDENTVVIYAGDNGSGFPFAKWTLYDAGINVPFIVRWPGHVKAGSVTNAMISFVDFLPTCMEAVGGPMPPDLDGRGFLAVLEGRASRHRDIIHATHTNEGVIAGSDYPSRAVRTERYKYIVNPHHQIAFTNVLTEGHPKRIDEDGVWPSWLEAARTDPKAAERVRAYQHRPGEELYDVKADPFELRNVAADPSHRELIKGLRAQLREWMLQQRDPLVPELDAMVAEV